MSGTILIMTYEYPPAAGSGVQRVAKFVRYLPDFGWHPVVLTSDFRRRQGRLVDHTLLADVAGTPVVRLPARNVSALVARPLALAKRARGALHRESSSTGAVPAGSAAPTPAPGPAPGGLAAYRTVPGVSSRVARWFSMDDGSWWARDARARGVALGRQHDVSAVLASGPPFSVLVAGEAVARELDVPLVADMRDGWRDNPIAWYPSAAARRRALQAELKVLASAAVVLMVGPGTAKEAVELGGHDVRVLPNGFDPADMVPWRPQERGPLRLVFMGQMYGGLTEPWDLFRALGMVRAERPDLDVRLDIVGDVDERIKAGAAGQGLSSVVEYSGYLPHAEAIAHVAVADVALVIVADRPGAGGVVTGKLFEYFAVGLPVLALAPVHGDAARIIASHDAGWSVAPHDVDAIAARVIELAGDKRGGVVHRGAAPEAIAKYERRVLTGQLAEVLDTVVAPATKADA
jgi:glycosyltransferase involved in cell wall biosynthesis